MGVGVRPHERPGGPPGSQTMSRLRPIPGFRNGVARTGNGPPGADPPGIRTRFAFSVALPYAYASVVIGKRKQFETIRPHRLAA